MERLTSPLDDNKSYIVDEANIQEAINRLAKFENLYDDLLRRQNETTKEMEKLKLEGKTHSVKFKQLFVDKLTNSNILTLFKTYGL